MRKLILSLILGILLVSCAMAAIYRGHDSVHFQSTNWSCSSNEPASSAFWLNSQTNERKDIMLNGIMNASGNCSLYGPICCPSNKYACNGTNGKCYRIYDSVCATKNNSADCWGVVNNSDITKNSVFNGSAICGFAGKFFMDPARGSCVNNTRCSCFWNGTKCNGRTEALTSCEHGGSSSNGRCEYFTPGFDTTCASGFITYWSIAHWFGNELVTDPTYINCKNITRTYTCPSVPKLPFFTFANMLFSFIAIALIYMAMRMRRDS